MKSPGKRQGVQRLFGSEDHCHTVSFPACHLLNHHGIRKFLLNPLKHLLRIRSVHNLPAAEYHGDFCLVAMLDKSSDVLNLENKVMLIDLRPDLDFLDRKCLMLR